MEAPPSNQQEAFGNSGLDKIVPDLAPELDQPKPDVVEDAQKDPTPPADEQMDD